MSSEVEASVRLSLVDRISAPIKRIQARMAGLSRGLGIDRIAASFGNLTRRIGGLGNALSATSGRFATLAALGGLGAGGVGAVLFNLTKGVADAGGELTDTAYRLGIGVEALQEYRYAAKLSGLEAATFTSGVEKLGLNAAAAAGGNKGLADTFKSLGVQLKDSNGKLRTNEEILDATFAGLARIENPARRNELAFKAFGRSGVGLVQMLMDGEEGLIGFREEARRTGHVMSAEAAALGSEFGDSVDRLMTRLEGLRNFLGVQLMPIMNDLVVQVTDWVTANQGLVRSTISEWVQKFSGLLKDMLNPASDVRQAIAGMADSVTGFFDALAPVIDFLGGPGNTALLAFAGYIGGPLITALLALVPPILAVGMAIMTTPIGWIIGGLALVGAAIYWLATNWDSVVEAWDWAWAQIVQAWNGFAKFIMDAWDGVMKWGRDLGDTIKSWFDGIDLGEAASALITGYLNALVSFWTGVAAWGFGLAAEVASWFGIDLYAVGEGIVQTVLSGLKAGWGQVTSWFDQAITGLLNAIPDWAKGPLGIEVKSGPLSDADIAARGQKAGADAAWNTPGANFWDSEETKQQAQAAKDNAYAQAERAEIARLRAENERLRAPGASFGTPLALAAPSAIPVETPQVTAGAVTAESFIMPEPLLVHKPQAIDASFNTGPISITVPPGMDAAQARSIINAALSAQAAEHRASVGSALND